MKNNFPKITVIYHDIKQLIISRTLKIEETVTLHLWEEDLKNLEK
jgi:hypothetical protein